ncbi:MAG: tetratricopeptide repeat protein, partial [Rhodocyclaceae bacterium]|nr:tetratricopeptide repeat protein [Rhodocyclaceae bacterium]
AGALAAYRQSATLPQSAARLAILTADTPDASGRPDDAAALGELLTLCGYAGDDARASRVVAKLVALAAAPALTEAGGTLARNGHLGVAREALEAAVALAPDALRAQVALVTVLNDLRCFGEARRRADAALARADAAADADNTARLWVGTADAAKELGDQPAAVAALQRALALAPARLDVLGSLQQLQLCLPGEPAGDYASALAYGEAV